MDERETSTPELLAEDQRAHRDIELNDNAPRILVVEPDPSNLKRIRVPCEEAGYVVVATGSGEEALILLNEIAVDLIIADWLLSDMLGFELVRRVDENESSAKIPFLIIPGRRSENPEPRDYFRWSKDLPIRWGLSRPFAPKFLQNVVARMLRPEDRRLQTSQKWSQYLIKSEETAN